jgi:hypothetical protein
MTVAAVDDELSERGKFAPAEMERPHVVDLERHAGFAAALATMTGAVEHLSAELLPGSAAYATVLSTEALVGGGIRAAGDAADGQGAHDSESASRAAAGPSADGTRPSSRRRGYPPLVDAEGGLVDLPLPWSSSGSPAATAYMGRSCGSPISTPMSSLNQSTIVSSSRP